ncbi:sucrose-specific PTS transporter subunit IIBC [Lacticaseibacillus saniviri]|uniref:protein-N(pi)-phosphohistidine--sucrose phosphotransferase n=1 Tax=Lacticaseibacillus saniviri JCM 17471 = DSM 24301 TaxID=1293598 RepID=A0A0R2MS41_9LACO|nr:sucrose-specific PTS transporter subunit IIBC [Lacticaseibacillus saniviri]KRO16399.1 sucrose PTS, EIIBCA [Lacticaseibacillus saniviri JCM 17471 = DSM 24301]MCG4282858.1 sucrose-specific PTS transporter subunit IIBC [Lacticaseibacillus saniviri]
MDHKQAAIDILNEVGKDNIVAAAHCATRLRLVVKDEDKIDQKGLDGNSAVKGTFRVNGQYQIIIGPGDVDKVYDQLIGLTGLKEVTPDALKEVAAKDQKKNPLMDLIKVLSDIFVPLIPALIAGGLLMALNNVLVSPGLFGPKALVGMYPGIKGLTEMINTFASAPFAFLPILLGFSATRRFGGNAYLGATMGMIMVMPSLINGYGVADALAKGTMTYWNVFGWNIAQAGYQGQVLPVLAVAFILANVEKWLHKKMPATLDFIFTPMITIIFTAFITFAFVGPVLRIAGNGLTDGIVYLYNASGFIGSTIFGLVYSPIVITGLHQSFPAIETQLLANIAKTGGDFFFPIASMANAAQGAACLAIFFLTKDKKEKGLASSSGLSALLGITEPAIFGVNLKKRFPFIIGMIGSAVGCFFVGLFGIRSSALGAAGIIGFISIPVKFYLPFFFAIALSIVVAFTGTLVYGKRVMGTTTDDDTVADDGTTATATPAALADAVVAAPVDGTVVSLKTVDDQVFASEMMGKGAAIVPSDDNIYAPVAGTITVAYPTKHAYGLLADDGAEVLIHLGIDTVKLDGNHFTTTVSQGQHIDVGEVLGTMDRTAVKAAGYDTTVMIVVTNTASYASVDRIDNDQVSHGDPVVALTGQTSDAPVAANL